MSAETSPEAIVIKKYANRRLYNTATSSYVTLDTLCQMVKDGADFVVYDAKTGENITKPVLTQIIFEEEAKGHNLLPASFLRQLIAFYGDSLQALVPNYLAMSMEAFTRNQEQFRHYLTGTLGEMSPFKKLDEMNKQNMVMFQRAMEVFNPFAALDASGSGGDAPHPRREEPRAAGADAGANPGAGSAELNALRAQLDHLQRQFDRMLGAEDGQAAEMPPGDAGNSTGKARKGRGPGRPKGR